ncbi:MAG: serine/threonine-protein kinase, partial [Planctomycetota bacterium]
GLLPGEFAATLPATLQAPFLAELEALADLDRITTGTLPRDLPLRFGDFRVLGELGRGAMGAVYAAEQVSTGEAIALKVLHRHVASDSSASVRFQREARTAASLVHPGIVPVLGFGDEAGYTWLAMGRVEGRSLQRLLAAANEPRDVDHGRARRLLDDPWQLARTVACAADALAFAHRQKVVHRDIKPANLMCRDDGNLVVLDFGLATAHDADAPTLTRTGDLLGTPLYMAPEQAIGAENGTAASDVYSLGAVLYECLCLCPPVTPGPLATVIDAILNRDPIDPSKRRAGVPQGLARIAMQCLEKDPRRRYASADALASDLLRFADGERVHARHSGVVRRLARRMRRRPVVTTLAAAVLVLVPTVYGLIHFAGQRDAEATTLEQANDFVRTRQLLALSPEGITVGGGASRRFYARLGLGDYLPASEAARSASADAALRTAASLAQSRPDDLQAQRLLARVLFDLGDEAAATDAVLRTLLEHKDANDADRTMAAVWQQQQGRFDEADRQLAAVDRDAPGVAFWLGIWHQNRQDYFEALSAFDRALREPGLDEELRYFAHLHRGWCQTCPELCRVRSAEDDLLQAAALRPNYGTAKLLWAALRCLDPTDDLSRPVAAVGEVLTAVQMEPWVVVLTARVLLALAEGGTWQAGPVLFSANCTPIAVLPLQPGRATALAGKGLELLDAVLEHDPSLFEPRYHRIAALTLLGRHAEALVECDLLLAHSSLQHRPAILLQRARVHLAAGRAEIARAAAERALEQDSRFVAAWHFLADLDAHVGDVQRELFALERAALHTAEQRRETSVFPDGAASLPDLQLRRARCLQALARHSEAMDVVQHGDFGGVLAGEHSPRVTTQRATLLAELRGQDLQEALRRSAPTLPADSPLQLLAASRANMPRIVPSALAAGLQRDWVPASARSLVDVADDVAWLPATANLMLGRGEAQASEASLWQRARACPSDAPMSPTALLGLAVRGDEVAATSVSLPLGVLLPYLPELVRDANAGLRLLELVAADSAHDADNGEARLVRAVVLC